MNIIKALLKRDIEFIDGLLLTKGSEVDVKVGSMGLSAHTPGHGLYTTVPSYSLAVLWDSVLDVGTPCKIMLTDRDYTCNKGIARMMRYGKYAAYKVGTIYFVDLHNEVACIPPTIPVEEFTYPDSTTTDPASPLKGTDKLSVSTDDGWSYIAQETGVDRQVVKIFLLDMIMGHSTILDMARRFKLSSVQMSHINVTFNEWAGVDC